jgi:hypothetical protein
MVRMSTVLTVALLFVVGCSGKQPEFADLHPVGGKVQLGSTSLAGGSLRFNPLDDKGEFIVNGEVDAEGSFTLSTVRTTDSKGERRPGAPIGEYNVVYTPESVDQLTDSPPITLPHKVVIEAKENTLTLEVPNR